MSTPARIGPAEIAVIELPGDHIEGAVLAEIADLTDRRVIRVLDFVVVTKDASGDVTFTEAAELDGATASALDAIEGEALGLLSAADLAAAADRIGAGTIGVVVMWENAWARELREAVGAAGGRLVAHDRLDAEAVAESLATALGEEG